MSEYLGRPLRTLAQLRAELSARLLDERRQLRLGCRLISHYDTLAMIDEHMRRVALTTTATAASAAQPKDQSIATSHPCSDNTSLRPHLYFVFAISGISAFGIILTLILASLRLTRPRG